MLKVLWRALVRRQNWEEDLHADMREHLEHRTADLIRRGLGAEDAARRARIEFGSVESYKELCREAHGLRWPGEVLQDLRYGWRLLKRRHAFTFIAVLTVALSIAVSTVVFGVIDGVLLHPLPVEHPERVYAIARPLGTASQSFPNYRDIRDRNAVFESLFAYRFAALGVEFGGRTERSWSYMVTENYFEGLRVHPALGRFFTPEESRSINASPWAVISYSCWVSRFSGDPNVVGRTIRINSHPYTILGVAPRGFRGTEVFYAPELWIPASMQPQIESNSLLEVRNAYTFWVAGRLKPTVSAGEANANLAAVAEQLGREHVEDQGMRIVVARPGLLGPALGDPVWEFATGVMLLAGLVVLAACTNLAGLFAVRSADRHREIAIRISIGASRARITRQLVTEAFPIAILGGAAGFAIAAGLLTALTQWRLSADIPVQFDVAAGWRAFLFAFVVAFLSGILFGIAPAHQAWKTDPNQGLKGSGAGGTRRAQTFRELVLAAQVTVCCVLITASFVSLRGLAASLTMPLGIEPRAVATAAFDVGLAAYKGPAIPDFQRRVLEAVERLPGVTSAAYSNTIPLYMDQSDIAVYSSDTTDLRPANMKTTYYYVASPGFLRTVGITLLAGRDFSWDDRVNGPPVAIVNETFARRILGGTDKVGSFFRNGPLVQVIGIVADGKYQGLTEEPVPALFEPILQHPGSEVIFTARTARPKAQVAAEMRKVIQELDPRLPVYSTAGLDDLLSFTYLPVRAAVISLGAFGTLAILLSITGIYGVAAHSVSRRWREIAIRVAVGARPSQVLRQVMARTAGWVSAGCLAGLVLGVIAARLMASIVYQASPRDPLVLGSVIVTMGVVGVAAGYRPVRHALGIDPAEVLRQE
jgi:predicted permease